MTKQLSRQRLILASICTIALFLRLYKLGSLPAGLHNDEVMNAYVGQYTLQNGIDLYGNPLPIRYFDNFGDYPNIIPMYLSGISTRALGYSAFAIRLPIALAGVFSVLLIYAVAKELFPMTHVPLASATVLALMPWHIVLSRSTAEAVTASLVFLVGLWGLIKARKLHSTFWLLTSMACFLFTYFLYPSFRLFIPLALTPTLLLFKNKSQKLLAGMGIAFSFITTIAISQTVWGKGRFDQTSVFNFLDILHIRLTNLIYQDSSVPLIITRLFHNKYLVAAREIVHQYLQYWSGGFLFTRGGLPTRYTLPDQGLLYLSLLVVVAVAVSLWLISPNRNKHASKDRPIHKAYLIYLTALSPLPAAMTLEDVPNVHRSLLTGVLLSLIFGLIINYIVSQKFRFKKTIIAIISIATMFEISYFWHQYSVHGPITQAEARHPELTSVVTYIQNNQVEYEQIYAPAENKLALRYLFATNNFNPNLAGTFTQDIHIADIGNISFTKNACPESVASDNKEKTLIITKGNCPNTTTLKLLIEFPRLDGHTDYRAFTNQ